MSVPTDPLVQRGVDNPMVSWRKKRVTAPQKPLGHFDHVVLVDECATYINQLMAKINPTRLLPTGHNLGELRIGPQDRCCWRTCAERPCRRRGGRMAARRAQ